MEELSAKWQDLTDIQQASITELIAGKRQGNIVSSLMTNFDIAQNALQTSLGSSGSAMEEHAKAMDSIELKLNSLKAAWQSFAQSFMDSSFLKGSIDALKGFVEVLEWLIDNFGLLGTIGLGTGIGGIFNYFKGAKEAKKNLNDVVNAVKAVTDAINNGTVATNMAAESDINSAAAKSANTKATVENVAAKTAEIEVDKAGVASDAADAAGSIAAGEAEKKEAADTTVSVAAQEAELEVDKAGAVADAADAAGSIAAGEAEKKEAADTIVSTAEQVKEITTDAVGTVTELGDAIVDAGKGAGGAAKGFKNFFGTLGGKVTIIGAVVAALALLYNQYKKNKEAAAEARQEVIENSNAYLEAASTFEQAYIKYSGKTNLTAEEESELESAINGTVDALGDKSSALQNVVNNSNDYVASLERIAEEELKAAKRKADDKLDAAEGSLIESAIGWTKLDGSEVDVKVSTGINPDSDEVAKVAKEIGEEYYKKFSISNTGANSTVGFKLSANADINEIIDYYDMLLKYQDRLRELELDDTDAFKNVTTAIGKMEEAVGTYIDALNDAKRLEYQYSQENGIPKTVEEYLKMRETILNMKDVSGLSIDAKMSIANSLDSDYGSVFDLSSVEAQARKFVGIIKGFDDGTKDGINEIGTVETFLNMRTAVNNNDCTVGQYLSELDNVTAMSAKFSDEEREQFNLAFGLDTDSIKEQYDDVYNYIKRNYVNNLDMSKLDISGLGVFEANEYRQSYRNSVANAFKDFISDMSVSELSATVSLIDENNIDFNNILENYRNVLAEAEQDSVDFSKTIYGNIDTNARQVLEWNSENLEKYKDALMSWELPDVSWDEVKKSYEDTISTVDGTWDAFKIDGKDVNIAFTPMLQTDNGAEYLSSGSVYNYINKLIAKATEDGKWDNAELLALDAEGIEIDGQKIKGIIADIGTTAEATAEQMHFVGKDGALALAEEELDALIKKRADLIEAMNYEFSFEIDTTALEALNTALSESSSAMGLSTESIDSLQSKYSDLEGYNPATLFEKTANGVKVNREEVAKLEKKYNDLNKSKVKEHIDNLTQAYNDNAKKIDECTNASERAKLISENETYKNRIKELAEYQAQLEGVTGAYQRWIDAQAGPEDYEGYEAVATSREDIQDEISRGFIGNATKEYIDLLSGEELSGKSIDDYANAWDKLDDKITGAGYSINDFFTVNDDGDITAQGIDRFFKSLQTDFKDSVAKFNDETQKWTYDFGAENLEQIREKWGIGIEAIELLLEAAVAAGYDIDWGGILDGIDLDTSSFETLVYAAEAAQEAYNKIDGFDDVSFNFTATGVEEAESEIERARQAFSKFINEDGTVNLEANGAEEMQFILTTLIIQKQQLSTPAIMKVDTSQIDQAKTDIIEAINAAQTLQTAYENYEIAISTGVDVEGAKEDLNNAISGMQGTSVDVRADLKLPTDADLEAAKNSIGNIEIGATLDGTSIGAIATQIQTQCTPEIIAKVTGIDETAITNNGNGRQVKYTPEHSEVDAYINSLTDIYKDIIFEYKTEGTKPNPNNIYRTITYTYETEGTGPAAGTAHAGGTTGHAFARGDWGIGGNGVALGGELGRRYCDHT